MLFSNLFLVHVYNHPAGSKWSKKTIEERDYDEEAEKTDVIYIITDSDDMMCNTIGGVYLRKNKNTTKENMIHQKVLVRDLSKVNYEMDSTSAVSWRM